MRELVRLRDRRHFASTMTDHGGAIIDAAVIAVSLVALFVVLQRLDLFDQLYDATRQYDNNGLDEVVMVVLFSIVGFIVFGIRRLQDQRREIKARQRAEDRARHLAMADTLTGLPNRRQFDDRLTAALAGAQGQRRHLALMMIDLDRFKPINDVFGHSVGDQALIDFARRASEVVGASALLARFGGDEFALMLDGVVDTEEAGRVARRLLASLDEPFAIDDMQVSLGASIGISMAPDDGTESSELLRRADIALYRAKIGGRGNFRFFEAEMDAQVQRRARIERDLRRAIAEGTVGPRYQPIVDLASGRVVGFEALAHWHHSEFGELEPDQLIGIAEDSGMIVPLSTHLLRIAARNAAQWPADVRLSFNISRIQLADPMLVLRVLGIIGEAGLSPTRLEVEISERALVAGVTTARSVLEAFHQAGVRIALDDFGTGNSSLQHLRACRFDRLKIDHSFVTSMMRSRESASLVNAILGLSKALGLPVTAEGIEDTALIGPLRAGGCSEGQGFRFGKALPAEGALGLLGTMSAAVPASG